jgi:hypothetical protein
MARNRELRRFPYEIAPISLWKRDVCACVTRSGRRDRLSVGASDAT